MDLLDDLRLCEGEQIVVASEWVRVILEPLACGGRRDEGTISASFGCDFLRRTSEFLLGELVFLDETAHGTI